MAQEDTRAYIVAVPMEAGLEGEAARVGAAARAALRGVDGVEWLAADRTFLGYSDYMLNQLQAARSRMELGNQAYLNLEYDAAIDAFSASAEAFDEAAGALEDPTDLGDALLYLAASHEFAGHARTARQTFGRLHIQMPHIRPDPNVFNPQVVTRYEQSVPRSARGAQAELLIESTPPGAIAYVDYVARGVTPLTVSNLMPGAHVVRVSQPGATPFVQAVDLRGGGTEQINAFLEESELTGVLGDNLYQLPNANVDEAVEGGPISEIGRALNVEQLGVIRVSQAADLENVELELLLFNVDNGRRRLRMYGPVPKAVGQLEAGVRQLVSGAMEAALARGSEAVVDPEVPANVIVDTQTPNLVDDEEPAIYERWYFWAGIGAAVLAVGAVVLTFVLLDDDLGQDSGGQIIVTF